MYVLHVRSLIHPVQITAKNIEYCLQGITGAPLNKVTQLECSWNMPPQLLYYTFCLSDSNSSYKQDPYQHVCLSLTSWQCCFSSILCTAIKMRLSRDCNLWLQQFSKTKSFLVKSQYMYFEPTVSDHVSQVTMHDHF